MLNTLYSLEAPLDILRKFDQIWGGLTTPIPNGALSLSFLGCISACKKQNEQYLDLASVTEKWILQFNSISDHNLSEEFWQTQS